jgi:acyl-CoA reductase-like NAD-dependent aldehyde dehydrogenase
MAEDFPLLVAGVTSRGKPLEVHAPFDGQLIGVCETADWTAADKALATAKDLYRNRDRWLPLPERLAILDRLMGLLMSRQEELAVEAAREGGKPLIDSRIEAARAVDSIRICIETLRTQEGRGIPMNLNAASKNRLAVTRFEPVGPVLAISAFNHPLNLIAHQVGPAIAAGCPCLVKPAEVTPLSCIRFVRMLYEAGLPEEWCQCVIAENLDVVAQMVADPRVAFLSFIGSARVGWMLRSKIAPGTRVALEHGGVAPVIIAADADLEQAVPLIAKGGFYHAGQVCVSVQRVFVHESIARTFAEKLAARARLMTIGDPTLPQTEIGPLIRNGEVARVGDWVDEAVKGGAELLCGGHALGASCFETTVLYSPPASARVTRDEVFGPVVCVYPFKDLDEALRCANDTPFAFQAAVFTRNLDTALHCYARLQASAVMVNDHTAFRVDWMPFAGLEQSGHGVGGIPYTIRDMQIEKMLVINSPGLK